MHKRPPLRKTSQGSLRLRLPERGSLVRDEDSGVFSRPSTDGAESQASSNADPVSLPPPHLQADSLGISQPPPANQSQQHSQPPHFNRPSWGPPLAAPSQSSIWQSQEGTREPSLAQNSMMAGRQPLRRQFSGPKPPPPRNQSTAPQEPFQQAGDLSRVSTQMDPPRGLARGSTQMPAPQRMESIPESPRRALPSAEEVRWALHAERPPPALSRPSFGITQQSGPGRGVEFSRASTPARGPFGGAPSAHVQAGPTAMGPAPVSGANPARVPHDLGGPEQDVRPPPAPIRMHGAIPSEGYGTDPPMATVSLVPAPGTSNIRAGPLGGALPSTAHLSQHQSQPADGFGPSAQQSSVERFSPSAATASRAVEIQPAPGVSEKAGKGKKVDVGSSAAASGSCSEHLRAIGLLCQAAAISGTSSSLSNQHLRSMRMLCQACLSGETSHMLRLPEFCAPLLRSQKGVAILFSSNCLHPAQWEHFGEAE